jgi:hypothetical protein
MSTIKNLAFLLFLSVSAFSISSCHDHDDDDNNVVSIEIVSPTDGSKAANARSVEVYVKFSASVEMHELEIKLHPDGDSSNNIIDFDKHTHDKTYEFKETVDLSSFAAGTKFHLEVEACEDHDCKKVKKAEAEFSI